jgi:hypothetical protein
VFGFAAFTLMPFAFKEASKFRFFSSRVIVGRSRVSTSFLEGLDGVCCIDFIFLSQIKD